MKGGPRQVLNLEFREDRSCRWQQLNANIYVGNLEAICVRWFFRIQDEQAVSNRLGYRAITQAMDEGLVLNQTLFLAVRMGR